MKKDLDIPLKRDKLYDQVANQIEKLIIEESFHPGDKLPSERNLAVQIGISRTVVREATRILNVRGLVKIKPGKGTFVQKLTPNDAAAPISLFLKLQQSANTFLNLCEVRFTLETEIAGLAAEKATDKDITAMEAAVQDMAGHVENEHEFVEYDLAFHSSVAEATQNDLYSILLAPITDLLLEFRLTAYSCDSQRSIEGGLTHHSRILNQIKKRDRKGAQSAMRDHLVQAQSLIDAARLQTGMSEYGKQQETK